MRFTQADLGFNHGWLVQAEAPPGALFAQFKRLLSTGAVASQDVRAPACLLSTPAAASRPSRRRPASPLASPWLLTQLV